MRIFLHNSPAVAPLIVPFASGLIGALAGWMLIGRLGSVSPQGGQLANIKAIMAVG